MPFFRDLGADVVRRAWAAAGDYAAIRSGQRAARRFGSFGEGSYIRFPMNVMFNEHCIHLGRGVLIGPHVTLTAGMVPGQQMLSDRIVTIGDGCVIGRGSEIVGHLSIELEDHVYTGPYVYITDQNHGWDDPSLPIGHQAAPEQPVRIGSGSWIGQGATVLPGVAIGRRAVAAAGAVVTKDVPDGAVVAGVPARVVGSVSAAT